MGQQPVFDQVRRAEAVGALAFGAVATATPRIFGALYGLPDEPSLRTMIRLWGTRMACIGVISLRASDPAQQRNLLKLAAALNVADTVIIARSGKGVSWRARALGSLTSAGFGAAAGYALTQAD